jgi:N-acetylneuraminic acid mutarotase
MKKRLLLASIIAFCMLASLICSSPLVKGALQDFWVEKAPMPQVRAGLEVAVVDGKIYSIGGEVIVYQDEFRSESKLVGTVEEYNPISDNWTEKTLMPVESANFATVVYNGKIYCIGGGVTDVFDSSRGVWETKQTIGFNYVYDPATDTWENKTAAPISEKHGKALLVNDKIYFANGYPDYNLMQVYDPVTDNWSAAVVTPVSDAGTAAAFGDKIYFFGGSGTHIFDTETETWSTGTSPAIGFYTGYAVVTTGQMAPKRVNIFCHPTGAHYSTEYSTQSYDPETDSWQTGADLPSQRMNFGVGLVDDVVYVIGGYLASYPSSVHFPQTYNINDIGLNEQYYPLGYGTIPPFPSILTPQNSTYNQSSVPLTFTLSRTAGSIVYSLDGGANVTITGNTTLSNLSNGLHNVTIYASDVVGVGASQTHSFKVDAPTFPAVVILLIIVFVAVIFAVMLILRFKGRPKRAVYLS